jgi:hypothetical protein
MWMNCKVRSKNISIGGSIKECKAKLQGVTKQVCDCSKLVQTMWSKSCGFWHFICICIHAQHDYKKEGKYKLEHWFDVDDILIKCGFIKNE